MVSGAISRFCKSAKCKRGVGISPPSDFDIRSIAEICVRVTPAEKKELQEKADAAHLSLSAEKKELQEKADAAHLSLSRYLVKSASDRKMLQTENIAKLIYEIRKIGINVNQIAHVANGQRFILQSDLVSLNRHMDAVIEITKKILKATYDEKEANIKTLERKIDKLMERVDANGND